MVGDLDNNSLDDNNIESEKNFLSMIFQSGFLPLMQRRTRAARKTDIAIDYIITDAILKSTMHSRIIKTNRFDQISMFIILRNSCKITKYLIMQKLSGSSLSLNKIYMNMTNTNAWKKWF